jgi:hypothetical protein
MPFDTERKEFCYAGLLGSRPVVKPVFVPNYNPNHESEDMGQVSPLESAFQEALGKNDKLIQHLAWVVKERGNGRTLFYILRDAEPVWGKEATDEIRRLVEEARFA